jgi:hypothetical protein
MYTRHNNRSEKNNYYSHHFLTVHVDAVVEKDTGEMIHKLFSFLPPHLAQQPLVDQDLIINASQSHSVTHYQTTIMTLHILKTPLPVYINWDQTHAAALLPMPSLWAKRTAISGMNCNDRTFFASCALFPRSSVAAVLYTTHVHAHGPYRNSAWKQHSNYY